MSDRVGFHYRYFLFQQGNLCSVPQTRSPSIRILGLYETDEDVLAAIARLREDARVNRLPILIGSCAKRGIVGLSLSRSMHAYVVQDKVRDVEAATRAFEDEMQRAKFRKRDSHQLEYGVTYDYVNRVMRSQNEMRRRMGKPEGWTTKQVFSYLLHNAKAPEASFDRSKLKDRLRELLDARAGEGKRVWTVGDESATSIEQIDWDRSVAKQLEHFQADLEQNLEKDPELVKVLETWPDDLKIAGQDTVYMHYLYDFTEEGLTWVDSLALGREPAYSILGVTSNEMEKDTNEFVRDHVLQRLDIRGMGVLSMNMYEWYDFSNAFDSRVKRVYNDERMQQYYDGMVQSQKMSRLIEDKAAEKNVSIKTITNDDIVKAIRDAADRGEDLVPQLTTQVTFLDEKAEGSSGAQEKKE